MKKKIKITGILGLIFLFVIFFFTHCAYIVPKSSYIIRDQTEKVKLKNYPELKDISFGYNTDLFVEFIEPLNLEIEKINLLFNDKIVGTIEVNKNIRELKDFGIGYTFYDEETNKKIIRKKYLLQEEFLRILGKNAKVYDSLKEGVFYLDVYIKNSETNEIFIINRNNISIFYESAGLKLFIPNI